MSKKLPIILLISCYLLLCFGLFEKLKGEQPKTNMETTSTNYSSDIATIEEDNQEEIWGTLDIPEIGLTQPIYPLDSPKNNVEENVTILKESILLPEENSIIFLAAHSGTGKKAFFTRLDDLKKGDSIIFTFKGKTNYYEIVDIMEQEKDGTISVPKNQISELVLTTCSERDRTKQLVIIAQKK
ncbi:MAG TPA: sortase [Candidatus Onthousia faecigallinarum]|nr:sortase [Candidatus Onthousia faecigallinarum]